MVAVNGFSSLRYSWLVDRYCAAIYEVLIKQMSPEKLNDALEKFDIIIMEKLPKAHVHEKNIMSNGMCFWFFLHGMKAIS